MQGQHDFSFHNNHIDERHLEPTVNVSKYVNDNDHRRMTSLMPTDQMHLSLRNDNLPNLAYTERLAYHF